MPPSLPCLVLALLLPLATRAQTPQAELANDPARAHDGPVAALRLQVLLDRARFSPGEIDGAGGNNTRAALTGFQAAHGLDPTGEPDAATWQALEGEPQPVLVTYTLAEADVAGPFVEIPDTIAAQAALARLGYASAAEAVGERFHASPALLRRLNPDARFVAGEALVVPNVFGLAALPRAAKAIVDRSDAVVRLLDAGGTVYAQFPASMGSARDPLPLGAWTVRGVTHDPAFHYNPDLFWDADATDAKATLPPGPNNPVGAAWIDLSKEHYGLHGTPEPAHVGKTESHGCIRLTNWDALAVASAVSAGTPVVLQE